MARPARSTLRASMRIPAQDAPESESGPVPKSSRAAGAQAGGHSHRKIDAIAILTGVLSAAVGIVALAGPFSMGMAFAAALSFIGLGLGFVAMGLRRRAAALCLAVVVGLSNLALFVGHPAFGEPGLDARALIRWWPAAPVNTYAMNPNAALGLFLVAVAVLCLAAGRNFRLRLIAVVLLGSAVVALGLYGVAGRLTGLQSTYGMEQLTGMVFPVAGGLVLLGAAVLAESWRQGCHLPSERQLWVLVVVAMTGIVMSTSLWRALLLLETLHFESAHQLRSYSASAVLLLGLLATALLGAAVYLVQTARQRVSVAERLRSAAEKEAAQRKLAEQSVARMNAYNRSLIEASIDPLVTIGSDGKITDVNQASEAATGCARAEMIGTEFSDYFTDPEKARAGYQHVFHEGIVRNYELELRHRGGETVPVLYNATVYHDEAGAVRGVFAAARDITERKQLETSLRQRTVELENAVAELTAFCYSVSHDLRAPLRSIDGFSQILLEDYHDRIDSEGQDSLRRIRRASQNMAQLIDALLELSRVTRSDLSRQLVDLSALAASVAASIRESEPDRRVRLEIAAGLLAQGDPRLLAIALQHLLQNAWKFTAHTPEATVQFGRTQKDGKPAYYVRDNGVGFDMTYVDKLFTPFQRLHAREQFEGTGIGLATVQRIIKRHGGRVWAEGAVGKGATFYFTLE